MFDFKVLSEKDIKYNTTQSNNEKGARKGNHNNQTNKTNMDKELQQVLASLFGENLLTLSEGQVYLFLTRYSPAAMKSSKTFCLLASMPALCHSSPYSLPPRRLTEA